MSARPDLELAVRAALHSLERASLSWQHADPRTDGPLHWPLAIGEAKRALAQALTMLEADAEGAPAGGALRCAHCGGTGFQGDDPCRFCDATGRAGVDRDAEAGIAWFNGLTPAERSYWLMCADSARPADAWAAFKCWGSRP
jgi:hypothetical protein